MCWRVAWISIPFTWSKQFRNDYSDSFYRTNARYKCLIQVWANSCNNRFSGFYREFSNWRRGIVVGWKSRNSNTDSLWKELFGHRSSGHLYLVLHSCQYGKWSQKFQDAFHMYLRNDSSHTASECFSDHESTLGSHTFHLLSRSLKSRNQDNYNWYK